MADRVRELRMRLKDLGRMKVRVGVMGENAARVHPNGNGATVGEIATRNHYGTTGVPARPFLTITARERKDDLTRIANAAVRSGKEPKVVGELVGTFAVGAVQEVISDGVAPANSPATIQRKGSSTPLIDTGLLRQSITFVVE